MIREDVRLLGDQAPQVGAGAYPPRPANQPVTCDPRPALLVGLLAALVVGLYITRWTRGELRPPPFELAHPAIQAQPMTPAMELHPAVTVHPEVQALSLPPAQVSHTATTTTATTTTPMPPAKEWPGFGHRFCGIVNNPHLCPEMLTWLKLNDPRAANILCKASSMLTHTNCELNMVMRGWEIVDPSKCNLDPHLFFLWDVLDSMDADPTGGLTPDPLCGGVGLPDCIEWAAQTWKAYVNKRRQQILIARNAGVRMTSPKFNGDVISKLARFFAACPDCNKAGSPYYIDVIAFNAWVNAADTNGVGAAGARIKDLAKQLKAAYGNRPVMVASLNSASSTAGQDANVISNSGLFDRADNPLAAIYWNVYPHPTSPPPGKSRLNDFVEDGPQKGETLGQVFVEKCGPER
mmetsp:Transcript_30008/g.67639  ORF Transcript_30008/g.67639 Transcript_30008/m.67639 type:complete len:407 (-) Transcript_30008:39-1259(-)